MRRNVRPRIPLAYAGLLIVAFVAVIGFAAFSPSADSMQATTADEPVATPAVTPASARVASAVLALRVSDAESRTATTESPSTTTTTPIAEVEAAPPADDATTADASTTSTEATTTTEANTTTTSARDTTPPSLKVTSPADGSTVTESLVTFVGEAEPGAHVASGPYAATIDEDGNWSLILVLTEGPNGAVFTATDHAGNSSTERIVVHYEPPQASTTTTTAPGATTTTTAGTTWSPLWPADAGGQRDVEYWRGLVAQYWPAERVDCALGLIYRESRGDPRAYNSYSWAEGLFQHLRKYWYGRAKSAGFIDGDGLVATPYNGEANIAAAAYIAGRADPWYRPWGSSFPESAKYGSCQSDDPA